MKNLHISLFIQFQCFSYSFNRLKKGTYFLIHTAIRLFHLFIIIFDKWLVFKIFLFISIHSMNLFNLFCLNKHSVVVKSSWSCYYEKFFTYSVLNILLLSFSILWEIKAPWFFSLVLLLSFLLFLILLLLLDTLDTLDLWSGWHYKWNPD